MARILIIDDEILFCRMLSRACLEDGHDVECAYSLVSGLELACSRPFDIVFLDVHLPDGNGLEKIADIRSTASAPEVIILTGEGTSNGAQLAIKGGAWDYISKPLSISSMTLPLMRALQYREEKLKKQPSVYRKMDGLIGSGAKMKFCYDLVAQAASCDASVLITGETGTGKELFAKAIHDNSPRASRSFVIVDCAALTQNLTESALFGYEKGAFTGADTRREGLIAQADGGTLFLDEIGELPLAIQRSFLRVLQEHRFRPLGGAKETESDFRLIAATNRNLDQMVEDGQFRQDLLYRIRSITLEVPPLRERREDVVEIAAYHIDKICKRSRIKTKSLSDDFIEALLNYPWPGNVRELVNALERSVAGALSADTLFRRHLPSAIRIKLAQHHTEHDPSGDGAERSAHNPTLPRLKDLREETYSRVEKKYLQDLMKLTNGNIDEACRIAALSRTRLYEILRKHQIKAIM